MIRKFLIFGALGDLTADISGSLPIIKRGRYSARLLSAGISLILCWLIGLITCHVANAENLPMGPTLPLLTAGRPHWASDFTMAPAPRQSSLGRRCREQTEEEPPEETIERVSGEDKGPRIPEPMVFDLIRPLGAKGGEREINVLGLAPLRQKSKQVDNVADPLGLVRRSPDRQGLEWAPELEYAVCDGVGLEFELPLENAHLEAYKAAGQITFGTALNYRFIHGAQAIVQYGRDSSLWTTTLLYLAGVRFDKTWSVFGMFGSRAEVSGPVANKAVGLLSNVTLFADVTDRIVAGIETNFGQTLGGNTEILVMPQLHYEIDRYWMIQAGVGTRVTTGFILPEAGFRIIREF